MSNIQMEALDFRYLLLEYYTKLQLSENELSTILMIDHLLGQKNTFITPDLLCLKMSLTVKELDDIYVNLIKRGFLIFDTGKKIKVSLKPLQQKLYELFEEDLNRENQTKTNKSKLELLDKLYKAFEEAFKRSLSPLETSIINGWVEHGYSDEQILDALRECFSKGKNTFKDIDKLLLKFQTSSDFDKTGYASYSENKWDKDIEKTMEIAKAKWIDD